jgi:hypothetical protein
MNPAIEDELLSAYLDGELSDAEKADVETRLAADPTARQALDELRAVSASVNSLPRYELGEDLAQRVLRLAEQRMLTETPTAPIAQPREEESRGRRFLRTRALVWAGMAVAIGLVFMLFDANRGTKPGDNDVAKTPPATKEPPQMVAVDPPQTGGVRANSGDDKQQPPVAKPADSVLLVKCYVSAEGMRKRAFDVLLARHNVARDSDDRLTASALARDTSRVSDKWAAEGKQKSFYAEVQPAAIQAVLEELTAKPELYPAVLVVGAPGVKDQEPWQAFSRDFDRPVSAAKPTLPASLAGSNAVVRVVFAVQAVESAQVARPSEQK